MQCIEALLLSCELLLGVRGIGIVRISQVGHVPFQPKGGSKERHAREIGDLLRKEAQATHAGLDFNMDWVGSGVRRDGHSEGRYHIRPIEHGGQAVGNEGLKLRLERRAHHENGILNTVLAKCYALFDGGDSKPVNRQLL